MEQDLAFLKDNIINFETVKLGFVRNIDFRILDEYERIYRTYVDPKFVLTKWCSNCVMDMLTRLMRWYEQQPTPESTVESTEKKKRGRPKK